MAKFFNRARKALSVTQLKGLVKNFKARQIVVNNHKSFASKYKIFTSQKLRSLQAKGVKKEQLAFLRELTNLSYIGRVVGPTQVMSIPARNKILDFLKKREELIIDSISKSNQKTDASAMGIFDSLKKGFEVEKEPKEGQFNEGVVERADFMLFGKVTKSKRVLVGRVALVYLGFLEQQYLRSVLDKEKFEEFSHEEVSIEKKVFGEKYTGLLI